MYAIIGILLFPAIIGNILEYMMLSEQQMNMSL